MKTLLTLSLILIVSVGMGQTKTPIFTKDKILTAVDIKSIGYVYNGSNEAYPDTLQCYFHVIPNGLIPDYWQQGYVVLIKGRLKNSFVQWNPSLAPAALGFFDNVFLTLGKQPVRDKVLQIALIK